MSWGHGMVNGRSTGCCNGRLNAQGYVFAFEFVLHDRLRKALEVAGVSVQDMATACGVSRNTVGNWLSGRTAPSRGVLMLWSTVTDAPLNWLETGAVPMPGDAPVPDPDIEGARKP